jgi:hypothetical protein
MADEVLMALANALGPYMSGQKASGTPYANAPLYVGGGLFGRCDGTADLINAMVGPIGFEKVLTYVGTDTEREFVDAWKEITESGSEQSTACGDCVSVNLAACAQFYCFGRFCRQTQELQFDRLGLRGNANVPVKTLFGAVTDSAGNVLIPNGSQITDAFALQARAAGYLLRLKHATMIWNGNPCNNAGSYQEFPGMQLIVNTGKYDAYTQLDCDSIDSFLMNFAFNAPAADGTYSVRSWFHRMVGQLKYRASTAGFDWDSATMYIVMSQNMWDCISRVYACSGVDLCSVTGQNRIVVNGDQTQSTYEDYLSRMALPVDGRWYPVVIDNLIPETTGQANGTCSDIYFVTTEINGEEILFGEYQDFNKTYGRTRQEMVSMFGSDDIAITDNGRFALVRDNSRGCFDVQVYTKPRLIAKAPWLSGRIQNVCCNVLQEPYPDVTGSGRVYEKDGGRSTTPVPTLYGDCVDC